MRPLAYYSVQVPPLDSETIFSTAMLASLKPASDAETDRKLEDLEEVAQAELALAIFYSLLTERDRGFLSTRHIKVEELKA